MRSGGARRTGDSTLPRWRLNKRTIGRSIAASMATRTATQPKSERTKSRVLREALALASRVGFSGLTFGTLAEQAGISKSGLFAHFESKEDLQIHTLHVAEEMFVERVLRPAVKEPRGVARLQR